MKNIILLTLLAILTAGVSAQSNAEITAIRAEVAAINKSAKNYQQIKKDVAGISGEGAEATYFLSGKELKKITAKMYGETFRATAEIYYSGEEPVFIYELEERYDKPMYVKGSKVASKIEKRFYYSSTQLIKHMIGKRTVTEGEDYERQTKGINEIEVKLKAALTEEN